MTDRQPASQRRHVHGMPIEDAPLAREYVEYHWGRILVALAIVVILAAVTVFGVKALLTDPDSPSSAFADSVEAPEERPVVAVTGAEPDESAEAAPVALAVPPEPTPSSSGSEPQGTALAASGQVVAEDAVPVEDEAAMPGDLPAAEGEAVGQPAPAVVVSDTGDDVADVEILAPGLARAQLTLGLQDKEPVDELPRQLAMNDEGLLHVYLFTETEGLKDQLHFHDWYLNGQRVARVRIRPYSDHMRASSSKFINRDMTGDWRVDVVSASGAGLATGSFVVLP